MNFIETCQEATELLKDKPKDYKVYYTNEGYLTSNILMVFDKGWSESQQADCVAVYIENGDRVRLLVNIAPTDFYKCDQHGKREWRMK